MKGDRIGGDHFRIVMEGRGMRILGILTQKTLKNQKNPK